MTTNIKYRATREQYPLMEVLALAVTVDRMQGFVKSGNSHYDLETDTRTNDNRTVVLNALRGGEERAMFVVTDEDRIHAETIFNYFDQVLLMDKISDNLVKKMGDKVNDYNLHLSKIFESGNVDVNKELAMLVSLPNSYRVAQVRDDLEQFYRKNSRNGYVGEVKQRIKISGLVKDVKYIRSHSIYLATVFTTDSKIVKFFLNEGLADIANSINGTHVEMVGTVKKQEINPITDCQETLMNRVKIQ